MFKEADEQLLREWISSSDACFVASTQHGEILWSNNAFRHLVRYTPQELTHLGWDGITSSGDELEIDKDLAQQCALGTITEYRVRKRYIPKNEAPIPCDIQVLRYPQQGELKCLLVSVRPLFGHGGEVLKMAVETQKQLQELMLKIEERQISRHKQIEEYVKTQAQATDQEKLAISIARLCNTHPRIAAAVGLVLVVLVLGSSSLDLIKSVISVIWKTNAP